MLHVQQIEHRSCSVTLLYQDVGTVVFRKSGVRDGPDSNSGFIIKEMAEVKWRERRC